MESLTAAEVFILAFCGCFAALAVAFLLAYNFVGLKRGFDMRHALGFLFGCVIVALASYSLGQLP